LLLLEVWDTSLQDRDQKPEKRGLEKKDRRISH
jgi:hypothetical protein